tara:strand:+ start:169 stop:576 length:408 start_codon:yes stop_codon:yes gene_type:complete
MNKHRFLTTIDQLIKAYKSRMVLYTDVIDSTKPLNWQWENDKNQYFKMVHSNLLRLRDYHAFEPSYIDSQKLEGWRNDFLALVPSLDQVDRIKLQTHITQQMKWFKSQTNNMAQKTQENNSKKFDSTLEIFKLKN